MLAAREHRCAPHRNHMRPSRCLDGLVGKGRTDSDGKLTLCVYNYHMRCSGYFYFFFFSCLCCQHSQISLQLPYSTCNESTTYIFLEIYFSIKVEELSYRQGSSTFFVVFFFFQLKMSSSFDYFPELLWSGSEQRCCVPFREQDSNPAAVVYSSEVLGYSLDADRTGKGKYSENF